jgi:hypothetical protein
MVLFHTGLEVFAGLSSAHVIYRGTTGFAYRLVVTTRSGVKTIFEYPLTRTLPEILKRNMNEKYKVEKQLLKTILSLFYPTFSVLIP